MFFPVADSLLYVFNTIVDLYELVVVVAVIATWLIALGVLSMRNDAARAIVNMLDALTEPVFRRIRRVVPSVGGIDFSPFIVIIALEVLKRLVNGYAYLLYRI